MNNYKWDIRHSKTLIKYNLSKHYQHGDILWKLHDKSIEEIGKYLINKNLQFLIRRYISLEEIYINVIV